MGLSELLLRMGALFYLWEDYPKKEMVLPLPYIHIIYTWIFQVCKNGAFSPRKTTKRQTFYISGRSRYTRGLRPNLGKTFASWTLYLQNQLQRESMECI